MIFTPENFLLIGSILLFVSVIAGSAGYRLGVPSLLLFLFVGMLFGVDGVGLRFSNFAQAQFVGVFALIVILFSGGLDTNVDEIKPIAVEGTILSTLGVVLTMLITGIFIYGLNKIFFKDLQFSMGASMLLAAVMSSTDSASVFSILRSKGLYLKPLLRPLLEYESGSNDPMAYMLTAGLIQYILSKSLSLGAMVWMLVIQFVLGVLLGYLLGRLAIFIINRMRLDYSALYSIVVLAFAFFIYSFTNMAKGNGFLAVYVAGLVMSGYTLTHKKSIIMFFDGIAWLMQIVMFLTLGLLVNPKDLLGVAAISVVIAFFMIIFARPITIFLCMLPFKRVSSKGKIFISWVGLRGAVPIIFATFPHISNIPGADHIFNIVFCITIVSLLVQGSTVSYFAKILDLLRPPPARREFAVDIPEDMGASSELAITQVFCDGGCKVKDLPVSEHALVMMVKRGEKYFVPKETTKIQPGDKLLLVADHEAALHDMYSSLGIDNYEIYKNK